MIEPGAADLPDRCCTLSISPLLRELIVELSDRIEHEVARGGLLTTLLLTELPRMPVQQLHLPISSEPRLQRIATVLADDPADRSTLAEWADRVALSESSLARLVVKETGLTFGRWRQQLHLIVALREPPQARACSRSLPISATIPSPPSSPCSRRRWGSRRPSDLASMPAQNGGSAFVA